ncbi:carbonic anhydrase [Stutzerimonas urumqiensis]|uniref:carbonic anhydrase n=1 Tax=Stutzerimonas urumqiensis TaxID=638269 RepID=UPI000EACD6E2|nr:carbonic anhydrase family protein [Stutzerimonas urumqiensis]
MNNKALCLVAVLGSSGAFAATPGVHWTYAGDEGPENWARLTPEFAACAGKNQSPINLEGMLEADLEPLNLSYNTLASQLANTGHVIQAAYEPGSYLTLDGRRFELIQFHFHVPSENHVQGRSFPLEGHLVHADPDGRLAVVAVMFEEGRDSAALAPLVAALPDPGKTKPITPAVDATALLPEGLEYYRFNGSLTTPPCTEGVRWLVLKEPVSASAGQIEALRAAIGHPNNRPLQPLNARIPLQ